MKASILAAVLMTAGIVNAQEVEVVSGHATLERTESRLVLSVDRDFDGTPDVVFELETQAVFETSGPAEVEFWQHGLSAYFADSQQLVFFGVENKDRPKLVRRPQSTWEDASFERVTVHRFGGTALTMHWGGGVSTMGERRPTPQPTPDWPGGTCASSCGVTCSRGSCSVSCGSNYCCNCACVEGYPSCNCSMR